MCCRSGEAPSEQLVAAQDATAQHHPSLTAGSDVASSSAVPGCLPESPCVPPLPGSAGGAELEPLDSDAAAVFPEQEPAGEPPTAGGKQAAC